MVTSPKAKGALEILYSEIMETKKNGDIEGLKAIELQAMFLTMAAQLAIRVLKGTPYD